MIIHISLDKCSCGFLSKMLLPCRHIMALRASYNLDKYCPELCSRRWTRAYSISCGQENISMSLSDISINSHTTKYNPKNKLSQSDKYNKIYQKLVSQAQYISHLPQDKFDFFDKQFDIIEECIQDDHLFFVIPSELTSSPNIKDLAHIPTKSSSDMTSSSNEIDLLDVPSNLPSDMAISPYLADVPSNLPSDMAISPYEIDLADVPSIRYGYIFM
ncbi:uncharacterized protein LOC135927584 isoform X1 [Gordionus sp. m RMFG-2023]|uniref:uncharacterized protein LOC135927584 isoform X1 n=1 Tax=Gordionus sp. m RMFG-2023 TaxID=3053472 RepID=UPI0031FDA573